MAFFDTGSQSAARGAAPGKYSLSLFCLIFLAAGLFFAWFMVRDAARRLRTWSWKSARCEIIASRVAPAAKGGQNSKDYQLEVRYRYTFEGRTFSSGQYSVHPESFSDYGRVARLAAQYPPGSDRVCYVNPAAPAEAVLYRPNALTLLLPVFFPMIFIGIGAGGIFLAWRRKPVSQAATQPISDRANWTKGRRLAIVFFLVFLLIGIGVLYGLFLRPLLRVLSAKQWPAVPCVVVSSEVRRHSGEDNDTYSINILYRYEFRGREYEANAYDFMGGSSSGYSSKAAVVARHPPGSKTVCYVNPNVPTDAVLERGFTPRMWFGLIPLVFVLAGAGGLTVTVRKGRRNPLTGGTPAGGVSSEPLPRPGSIPAVPDGATAETILLKPKSAPLTRLLVMIGVALFWNGILSVFVSQAIPGWRAGRPDWALTVFLIPFVLVGLGWIGGIGYAFLALFNPRPRLKLTPGTARLGDTLRVEWEIRGRAEALHSLQIRLQGREEATYRRGTRSATDRSTFALLEIAEATAGPEIQSGSGTLTLPADLMHSFASDHNKIVWSIQLRGPIARWPDLKEEFPLTVLPALPGTSFESS